MSRNQIIGNLKKLLMCNKRQQPAGDDACSLCDSTESELAGDSSSDSMLCQPRLTLEELRRRQILRHGAAVSWIDRDESESPKTLCSDSLATDEVTGRAAAMKKSQWSGMVPLGPAVDACTAAGEADGLEQPGKQAEICLLESCDLRCTDNDDLSNGYSLAHADDLKVTEYPPIESLTYSKNAKVVNNALLCFQPHLKAEQCEVNCHRTNSSTVREHCEHVNCVVEEHTLPESFAHTESNKISESSDLDIHVADNISNMAMFQPSSCNTTCQRSALRVQLMTDISEPTTACASLASSEEKRSSCTACWPDGDVSGVACKDSKSAAIDSSFVDGNTTVSARDDLSPLVPKKSPKAAESAIVTAQTNDNVGHAPDQCQTCTNCQPPAPIGEGGGNAQESDKQLDSRRNRIGIMSAELFLTLGQDATGGTDLVQRYLEKRDVSETTRICHQQRYGRIQDDQVQKILLISAEAAAAAAADSAADTPTSKSAPSPPRFSARRPGVSRSASRAKEAAACPTDAAPNLKPAIVGGKVHKPGPLTRSPRERRKARIVARADCERPTMDLLPTAE